MLLTNFSMRGMSGRELARIVELERPGIKVLYAVRVPGRKMVWDAEFLKEGPSWLAKPFTMQLLCGAKASRKSLGVERRVILVVEEGEDVRAFLRAPLEGEGYDVMEAASLIPTPAKS